MKGNYIETVAAYVRVSTQEQKLHGLSLDAQKMKLQEYADNHNMHIVEWYLDEGVSGRKLIKKRPALQQMINDAEQGKFTRIIFIKLDRFFRSVAEYHECMKRISPVVWTTTEEQYDLSTANGRMLVNMKLTIAELEADQTGERINLVNEYKRSTGQPLTGSMPLGYMIETDPATGRKKIVKNPDEAPIVEDLLQYTFTHQSKRKTLKYLKDKYNLGISYNTLSLLLKNTFLYGEYRGNTAYTEGYITKEQFLKLQDITRRNVKSNSDNEPYIFSGLIKCPYCGRRLAGRRATVKKPNGNIFKYKSYSCANNRSNFRCSFNKSIYESTLERLMLDNIEKYFEELKVKNAEIQDSKTVKAKGESVEEINNQIDRLNYSWQTGKIRKVEQYEQQYNKLIERLKEAEKGQQEVATKDYSKIDSILQSGWKGIYQALDAEHKRAFWRSFIQSIEVTWTTEIKRIDKVNFF